jgi:CHRD domain-containing protein
MNYTHAAIKTAATLATALAAASGAAAGTHAPSTHSRADVAITVLHATLTGKYLHTTSAGTGTATITIARSKVCWKFSYSGLDKTNDSGIHIAPPPVAGKHKTSVYPFSSTTTEAHQCASPTKWGPHGPSWLTKIAANPRRFYVIIATTKYPQGAIGGVLVRS